MCHDIHTMVLTKRKNVDLFLVEFAVVLAELLQAACDGSFESYISLKAELLFPCALEFFKCRDCTPESWLFTM